MISLCKKLNIIYNIITCNEELVLSDSSFQRTGSIN